MKRGVIQAYDNKGGGGCTQLLDCLHWLRRRQCHRGVRSETEIKNKWKRLPTDTLIIVCSLDTLIVVCSLDTCVHPSIVKCIVG